MDFLRILCIVLLIIKCSTSAKGSQVTIENCELKFASVYLPVTPVEFVVKQPRNCNSTKELWIQRNPDVYLEFIPKETFQKFKNIQRLVLENVRLKTVVPSTLTGAKNLKILVLNDNHITYLENDSFKNAINLQMLSIRGNLIEEIENNAFSGLFKLRDLRLDFNRLTKLNESFFTNLHSLEKITLNHNKIAAVSTKMFSENSKLQFIDLSFNQLTIFDMTVFTGLPNLYTVHLNKNHIIKILNAKSIINIAKLRTLDLKNNTCIHQSFFFKSLDNFEVNVWNCTGGRKPIVTSTLVPTLDESSTDALESHRNHEHINFVNIIVLAGFVVVVLIIGSVILIVRCLKRRSRQSPPMIRERFMPSDKNKNQAFYENIDFRQKFMNDQLPSSEIHSHIVWSPTLKKFVMKDSVDIPQEYSQNIPFS